MMGDVDLAHYSAALDEIYRLRCALAYEAEVVAEYLTFATLPTTVRRDVRDQLDRLRAAACGGAQHGYAMVTSETMKRVLREAGASETLTRGSWETSR
jgi:phosphoribosylcarboxyaminoimidazole (NCAIR) mutase